MEKENEEKNSKVITEHLNVRTVEQLDEYLHSILDKKYEFRSLCYDYTLKGYIDGIPFDIIFVCNPKLKNAEICLAIYDDYLDDEKPASDLIKNLLTSVMWGLRGIENNGYCSCILDYDFFYPDDDYEKIMVWDTIQPEKTIFDFLVDNEHNDLPIDEYNIYYPADIDEILEKFSYGKYTGNLSSETVKRIEKMSEFEIFYSIKTIMDKLEEYKNSGNDVSNSQIENLNYAIAYLFSKTGKFGIEPNEPCEVYVDPNQEQIIWFSWWEDALAERLSEEPKLFENWSKKFPNGIDPSFKPKLSFEKYLNEYDEIFSKQEQEEEQRIEAGKSLIDVLSKILVQKKNSPSAEDRANNLFDEILFDTANKEQNVSLKINNP